MTRRSPDAAGALVEERTAVTILLVTSALLGVIGITWGLPNDDVIWSTDALSPMAPLAAAYRLFGSGWNSGWFYYKYPLGHPLLMAAVYAPYLGLLWLTGGLGKPTQTYPYGFADPERTLYVLALLGRGLSAAMTTGAVLCWYLACRELVGRGAAWLAGWFLATMYPVVFYAHTTNVDAGLLLWCTLAAYGAARVFVRGDDRLGMILFGIAAAMALSTKEYAFGLMVSLAMTVLVRNILRWRHGAVATFLPRGTFIGIGASAAVFVVMNGILWNPLGMYHRALFLTDSMPEALRLKYAPRFSHVGSMAPKDLATELQQLLVTLRETAASTSWPVAAAALVGFLVFGWRSPGLFFTVAAIGYYLASLRSLEMVQVRYTLPLSILATGLAGWAIAEAGALARRRIGPVAAVAVAGAFVLFAGACGGDATRLLVADTRYDAEAWMTVNARDASVDVFQRDAYLPRFPHQRVTNVGFDDISTAGIKARQPDLIVLSSAGIAGVTVRFKNDLDEDADGDHGEREVSRRGASGNTIAFEYARNRNFLDALEQGCLGYDLAATFERKPLLAVGTIPSLSPTIRVYRRGAPLPDAAAGENCKRLLAEPL